MLWQEKSDIIVNVASIFLILIHILQWCYSFQMAREGWTLAIKFITDFKHGRSPSAFLPPKLKFQWKEWGKQFCLLKCYVGEKEKYSQTKISARTEMVAVAQKLEEIATAGASHPTDARTAGVENAEHFWGSDLKYWQSLLPSHRVSVFNLHNCFLSGSRST